ncbi:DUF6125 family protein [Chloroflexota bacterium]
MTDPDFSAISAEALNEVCFRNLYTVDGLWFLAVEEQFGFETAFKMNQAVWEKGSFILGKRLLNSLDIEAKTPLQAFITMVLAEPLMVVHNPEVTTLTDTRAILHFIECPIQVARIRDGRGVYDGEPGCTIFLKTYAGLIDPDIEVNCLACAPNPEKPDYWCEWEFTFPQDKGNEK